MVGTIFENTKIPLKKWFITIFMMTSHKKSISSLQLARDIGVTQKTAWFMLHRIRETTKLKSFDEFLSGEIEADETYIGGKNKNKHNDKKTKGSQGRNTKDKIAVFGILQRNGNVKAKKVEDVKGKTLKSIICDIVKKGSTVMTDEWSSYNGLKDKYIHKNHNMLIMSM